MAELKDGTILRGGFTVDLVTAGITVIVDNVSLSSPSNVIERMDENGEPAAQLFYDGFETGTATIQVNVTAAKADIRGDTFVTSAIEGSSQTYIITDRNITLSTSAAVTADISFRKQIGS